MSRSDHQKEVTRKIDVSLTIALIIPTLNEVEPLPIIYKQIDTALFDEILVIDGGSTDGTIEICKELELPILIQEGVGFPRALNSGLAATTSDAVIIFSPDGNSRADKLADLCNEIRKGYDMVIVSRYKDDAYSDDDDLFTRLGNWFGPKLVNFLFGSNYTDITVCYRAYRREAVDSMRLAKQMELSWLRRNLFQMTSWEIGSCCRAARLNLDVTEIPGSEPKRIGGERKMIFLKSAAGALLQIAADFLFYRSNNR